VADLLDQQSYVRQSVPEAEKARPHGGSRARQGRPRESAPWRPSLRAVGCPPAGTRWVVVADRGADIYEHLRQCQALGLALARAAQHRVLVPDHTLAGRLFAVARAQPPVAPLTLTPRGQPPHPAREVVVQVSYSPALAPRAPQRAGGATGKGVPVAASVVRVWEAVSAEQQQRRSGVAAALRRAPARRYAGPAPRPCAVCASTPVVG
jgi:hypothetical protein